MNCQELRERMLDHSELDALSHAPEVASHLESCPGCRERLAMERRLAGTFLALTEKPLPPGLANRIRQIPEINTTPAPTPFWIKMLFGSGLSLGLAGLLLVLMPRTSLSPQSDTGRIELARAKTELATPAEPPRIDLAMAPTPSSTNGATAQSTQGTEAAAPAGVVAPVTSTTPVVAVIATKPATDPEPAGASGGSGASTSTLAGQMVAAVPAPVAVAKVAPTTIASADAADGSQPTSGSTNSAPGAAPTETRFDVAMAPQTRDDGDRAEAKKAAPKPDASVAKGTGGKASATPSETWVTNPHLGSSAVMTLAKAETAQDQPEAPSAPLDALLQTKAVNHPAQGPKPVVGEPLRAEEKFATGRETSSSLSDKSKATAATSGEAQRTPPPLMLAARPRPAAPPPPAPAASKRVESSFANTTEAERKTESADRNQSATSGEKPAGEKEQIFCMVDEAKSNDDSLIESSGAGSIPEQTSAQTSLEEKETHPLDDLALERRDRRAEKLEEILRNRLPNPQSGPIDIDSWVLKKWLTVKERIDLAPPRNHRWAVARSGQTWRVRLESIPTN